VSASGLSSILRNSAYLASARGLTLVVRVVYVFALARVLGPELYGLFTYGMSWYLALLPLSMLGLDMIAAREVGRRTTKAEDVVNRTFALRLASSGIVAIVSSWLAWVTEADPLARTLLLVFSAALVGRALALWSEGVFTVYEDARQVFRVNLLFHPLEVAIGIAVLLAGGGVVALAVTHTAVWWGQALLSLPAVGRLLSGRRPTFLPGADVLPLLRAGIPLGSVALLESWLLNGPLIMFRQAGGAELDLGQLSLAMQALMVSTTLAKVVSKASLPVVARSVARGDNKDRLFSKEALRLCAWAGLAAWLVGSAAGPPLVAGLFGERYAATGVLLGPVLALFGPFVAGSVLVHVLMAHGDAWRILGVSLVAALVMSLSQPWLQQEFGLHGVVTAMAAGYAVWLIGAATLLNVRNGLRVDRTLGPPVVVGVIVVAMFEGLAPYGAVIAFAPAALLLLLACWWTMRRSPVVELMRQGR